LDLLWLFNNRDIKLVRPALEIERKDDGLLFEDFEAISAFV
jgi:hypothetical protein